MKTAVIYARVSSLGDRQSTARQVADLSRYAEYSGLAIEYAKTNSITLILVSELSRVGRNAFEVLVTIKELIDSGINIYFQKEQFSLLDEDGKTSLFAPIMIATLSTCAQLEKDNIQFRLQSGRKHYVETGGRLGRKPGSVKSKEQKENEYRAVIRELRRGTSVRRTAKLCDISTSTVQRIKSDFNL